MFNVLAKILVAVGVCLFISALIPISQLIRQIPFGPLRRKWYAMAVLIAIFIVGYIGYIHVFWQRHSDCLSLIVPGIFFLGAGFVRLTSTLSLQTAADARRMALLEQESITDPLLGIYNRRYLDRHLSDEATGVRQSGQPLSVLLLDIDHFKYINDAHGHQVGDQVLICLGELTRHVKRDTDIAIRYGGDELLIIAPNTTAVAAATLAERLRRYVETHAQTMCSKPNYRKELRFTVSIGVASLCQEISGYQQLLAKADEALYQAKQEGRNRVIIYRLNVTDTSCQANSSSPTDPCSQPA